MADISFKDRVIEIVKEIPLGRVTTYGTVAILANCPRGARIVGGILHFHSDKFNLPWHRIINREGFISTRCKDHMRAFQKALLIEEGIEVSKDFMVNLEKYSWPSCAETSEGKLGTYGKTTMGNR